MKFKQLEDPITSNDTYYDLFDGGYIVPEEILADVRDVIRVRAAIETIREFLEAARETGTLEED